MQFVRRIVQNNFERQQRALSHPWVFAVTSIILGWTLQPWAWEELQPAIITAGCTLPLALVVLAGPLSLSQGDRKARVGVVVAVMLTLSFAALPILAAHWQVTSINLPYDSRLIIGYLLAAVQFFIAEQLLAMKHTSLTGQVKSTPDWVLTALPLTMKFVSSRAYRLICWVGSWLLRVLLASQRSYRAHRARVRSNRESIIVNSDSRDPLAAAGFDLQSSEEDREEMLV